jgi:hypothetical protein
MKTQLNEIKRIQQLAGIISESNSLRKFDPGYKLTYYEDNNLEKAKTDIIQDAMEHIKYVALYFGTDKANELNSLLMSIKNASDAEELGSLLGKISDWFYDNTDIRTEMGPSKMEKEKNNS